MYLYKYINAPCIIRGFFLLLQGELGESPPQVPTLVRTYVLCLGEPISGQTRDISLMVTLLSSFRPNRLHLT